MSRKYPISPSQFFLADSEKRKGRFYWWYQDKNEFRLWERLNSMNQKELEKEHELVDLVKKKYGNIYFFNPFKAQRPMLESDAKIIVVHGDNNSGKSYGVAAKFAYEFIGWSPFFAVKRPKYGQKTLWSFSPNYKTQVTSAQEHLFAKGADSLGLLPPLELIDGKKAMYKGGYVTWGSKKNELHNVFFPSDPPTYLEMRSAESSNISSAASQVDVVWLDEDAGETKFNEAIARVFRKSGKVYFSFLILPPETPKTHYISSPTEGMYKKWQDALKSEDEELRDMAHNTEFYFWTVKDNESVSEKDKKFYTHFTSGSEARIRYSKDGMWTTEIEGELSVPNYSDDLHLKDDLAKQYDPDKTMFIGWDLGKLRPAVVAAQIKDSFIEIPYAKLGFDKQLVEMMEIVNSDMVTLFPELRDIYHILPHDAKTGSHLTDEAGKNTESFFRERRWDYKTIYVYEDVARERTNWMFGQSRRGYQMVQIDPYEAADLVSALNTSVLALDKRSKTRKYIRKADGISEHMMDAIFKLFVYFHDRLGLPEFDMDRTTTVHEPPLPTRVTI